MVSDDIAEKGSSCSTNGEGPATIIVLSYKTATLSCSFDSASGCGYYSRSVLNFTTAVVYCCFDLERSKRAFDA